MSGSAPKPAAPKAEAPTLGRIVHVKVDDEWLAAIVVKENGDTPSLQVFSATNSSQGHIENAPATDWRWPPRAGA